MSTSNQRTTREGIAQVAREIRDGLARTGGRLTQEQAERRVREAVIRTERNETGG